MKEKELILDINGKEYKVKIHNFGAETAEISVDDAQYSVGLKDLGVADVAQVKPSPAPRGPQSTTAATLFKKISGEASLHRPKTLSDGGSIVAPLPGLVMKIYVKEGDDIKLGQPVMMLEAMKMENEVTATAEGVIIDIRYKEGDSVNQGETIILLKAAEA